MDSSKYEERLEENISRRLEAVKKIYYQNIMAKTAFNSFLF